MTLQKAKVQMEKNENFSRFPTAPIYGGKDGDDPQLYEPIIHHILQKKKLVDS